MATVRLTRNLIAAGAPKGKYGRSSSLKWPWLYDKLVAKGYDHSKAAAISNSRIGTRKTGRLNVLQADEAHSPAVLRKVAQADKDHKHRTRKQLTASARVGSRTYEFACHSAACAPPPAGVGGSKPGGGKGSTPTRVGDIRVGHVVNFDKHKGNHAFDERKSLLDPAARMRGSHTVAEVSAERGSTHSGLGGGTRKVRIKFEGGHEVVSNSSAKFPVSESGHAFPVIHESEARGDSRPVSHEEFQRLAAEGQKQLDKFAADKSPTTGLNEQWGSIKSEAHAEVLKPWGGATIDSHTGKALPQGDNSWAITVKGKGSETVSVHEGASPAEFSAAMDKAKTQFGPILERQSHYLGVFHDDANHRIDIDPVIVVRRREDVDTIGAASRSIGGAYNFKDGNGYWPPHVKGG